MTTASKVGIGVGAVAAIAALVWFSGLVTIVKTTPELRGGDPGSATPIQQTLETPLASATQASNVETSVTAGAAPLSTAQDPPIAGVWQVVSCTFSGPPSGQPEEVFDIGDTPNGPPLVQVTAQGGSLTISFLEPWNQQVPWALKGTRDQQSVELRADKQEPPLVIRGGFNSNWTQLTAEGGCSLEDASPEYLKKREEMPEVLAGLEAMRFSIKLKKLGDAESAARLVVEDTLEKWRLEAKAFAKAIGAYAKSHKGALPSDLAELAKEGLIDESLLKEAPHRTLQYAGGAIPAELLDDGTSWDQFNLTEPIGERIVSWEAYQQMRWGKDSPILSPALTIEYDEPYLLVSIDAFGNAMERDYRIDAPGAEDTAEARAKSQLNLKGLVLLIDAFTRAHDGMLPGGWCSMYPDDTNVRSFLTHPLDQPGTVSYVMLISGQDLTAFIDTAGATAQSAGESADAATLSGEIPLLAEAREHGTNPAGRNVTFADGRIEFMTSEQFAQACQRFGIAVP
ncbi:MAG: hypothetical protein WC655_23805 [Candidatus Hydrogenedentales bacterium]